MALGGVGGESETKKRSRTLGDSYSWTLLLSLQHSGSATTLSACGYTAVFMSSLQGIAGM